MPDEVYIETPNLPAKIEETTQLPAQNAIQPRSFGEIVEWAEMFAKTSNVPKDYQNKPRDIVVAILWGREIGLPPLRALNSIAIVNGRPGIFGDAALALVWGSGLCLTYDDCIEGDPAMPSEWVAIARSWRRGTPNAIERRFSATDAKRAKLWSKPGPWQEYPRRMLIMRARGFLLRDLYPDVLSGIITTEELRDTPLMALRSPQLPPGKAAELFSPELAQTSSNPASYDGKDTSPVGSVIHRPPPLKK